MPTGKCTQYFKGDVLFSNIRTYFRKIWFADRDGACSNDVLVFRADPKVLSNQFLYYTLLRRDFTEYSVRTSIGAKMPRGDKAALQRFEIEVPCLHEQSEIAAALGALDNKIELNRRMAATLEAMARALYRSWFVDFDPVYAKAAGRAPAHMDAQTAALFPDRFDRDGLPVGWKCGTLGCVANLNPTKHTKKRHPEQIEYVDLGNTKWGMIESTTAYKWEDAPSRARLSLASGDTIIGTVRPGNGSFSFVPRDGLTGSTGFADLRPKLSQNAALIYLAATHLETIESLANLADGGCYPAVRPEVVLAQEIVLASENVLHAFSIAGTLLIERIEDGKKENQTLAALRDTLLPRKMSVELHVGEAREQVEEVV
ncbi:MAG: restriction endonuclease subunit S [Rhodobacteraceae bacterium]|nr:restriction endonuclease subunit S [Paracoccaceae bacterium]